MNGIVCLANQKEADESRGLAGTILVYKVASALSDQGASLDVVEKVAKYVSGRLGTLGIGLEHCLVSLLFHLGLFGYYQADLQPGSRNTERRVTPESS